MTTVCSLLLVLSHSVSAHFIPDTLFDHESNEDFNGETINIGWLKYAQCEEGQGSSAHALRYRSEYTLDELVNIAQYALTIKFLPSSDIPGSNENIEYAIKADICSNPVYALNNGYELSYTLDETTSLITGTANTNNWIGSQTAIQRMVNHCTGNVNIGQLPNQLINGYVYWACGNGDGMHILPHNQWTCLWDYAAIFGQNISIWLGFDAYGTHWCQTQNDSYQLETAAPTQSPQTRHPTQYFTPAPISCGDTRIGSVFPYENHQFIFTSHRGYYLVYLESCASNYDTSLQIMDSNHETIQNGTHYKHGDAQITCAHPYAGDVTVPKPVYPKNVFSFIVGGGRDGGDYSVTLFCYGSWTLSPTKPPLPYHETYPPNHDPTKSPIASISCGQTLTGFKTQYEEVNYLYTATVGYSSVSLHTVSNAIFMQIKDINGILIVKNGCENEYQVTIPSSVAIGDVQSCST